MRDVVDEVWHVKLIGWEWESPSGSKGLYEWGSRSWKLLVRLGDEDVCHSVSWR